jgi:hypothetical protein
VSHYLRRFAKGKTAKKDKSRGIRLPSDIDREFEEHCRKYGLSFNEGILYLIIHELGKDRHASPEISVTNEAQSTHKEDTNVSQRVPSVAQQRLNLDAIVSRPRTNTKRFSVKPYEVDGYVPCPICRDWYSYTNYARHCKTTHGKGSQQVIEENKEIVEQMVKEMREG